MSSRRTPTTARGRRHGNEHDHYDNQSGEEAECSDEERQICVDEALVGV